MGIQCECDCNCKFRFKNKRYITTFLLTFGFTLSLLSDLDCSFVRVDVGFVPNNSIFDTSVFGVGFWSFEDPTARGQCIFPHFANEFWGLTVTDTLYRNIWLNGDIFLTLSRILATIGLFSGFVAMVCYKL